MEPGSYKLPDTVIHAKELQKLIQEIDDKEVLPIYAQCPDRQKAETELCEHSDNAVTAKRPGARTKLFSSKVSISIQNLHNIYNILYEYSRIHRLL